MIGRIVGLRKLLEVKVKKSSNGGKEARWESASHLALSRLEDNFSVVSMKHLRVRDIKSLDRDYTNSKKNLDLNFSVYKM